jgi:hypothetical protein
VHGNCVVAAVRKFMSLDDLFSSLKVRELDKDDHYRPDVIDFVKWKMVIGRRFSERTDAPLEVISALLVEFRARANARLKTRSNLNGSERKQQPYLSAST